jgi:hypothetical protein
MAKTRPYPDPALIAEIESDRAYVGSELDQPNLSDTERHMWQSRYDALSEQLDALRYGE